MKNNILTISGNYFDFDNPEFSEISIEDIAYALSNICRFTGHCNRFYSVAQHSVLVSREVDDKYALEGLLHDAPEAFIGDVSSPLKRMLPDYKKIEHKIELEIMKRFGIKTPLPAEVKRADLVLLATEKRDLMPSHSDDEWEVLKTIKPLKSKIDAVGPLVAMDMFLNRYHQIVEKSYDFKYLLIGV